MDSPGRKVRVGTIDAVAALLGPDRIGMTFDQAQEVFFYENKDKGRYAHPRHGGVASHFVRRWESRRQDPHRTRMRVCAI